MKKTIKISNKSGIYKIKNIINGKFYIGSAVNLCNRKCVHFSKLKNQKHHNLYLQNSYNKFGSTNFEFLILEFCSKQNLLSKEQRWLDKEFDEQKKCYNFNKFAGSWLGRKHSKSSKKKMSISHIGKKINQATKTKMSISHIGKRHTKETIEILSKISRERQKDPRNCSQWGKIGKYSANKRKTKVIFEGGKYKIFSTVREAAEQTDVNPSTITRAIKNRNGKVRKFIFIFMDHKRPYVRKSTSGSKNKNAKKVSVYNLYTKDKRVFLTIKAAANFIKSPPSSISRSLHHKNGKIRNFIVKLF